MGCLIPVNAYYTDAAILYKLSFLYIPGMNKMLPAGTDKKPLHHRLPGLSVFLFFLHRTGSTVRTIIHHRI
jgi:hypothetical protein